MSTELRHVRIYARTGEKSMVSGNFWIKDEESIQDIKDQFADLADDYGRRVVVIDFNERDMEFKLLEFLTNYDKLSEIDLALELVWDKLELEAMKWLKIHESDLEEWKEVFKEDNDYDATPIEITEWFLEGIYYYESLAKDYAEKKEKQKND